MGEGKMGEGTPVLNLEHSPYLYTVLIFFLTANYGGLGSGLRYGVARAMPIAVLAYMAFRNVEVKEVRDLVTLGFSSLAIGDFFVLRAQDPPSLMFAFAAYASAHLSFIPAFYKGEVWANGATLFYSLAIGLVGGVGWERVGGWAARGVGILYAAVLSTALWLAVSAAKADTGCVPLAFGYALLALAHLLTAFRRFEVRDSLALPTLHFLAAFLLFSHFADKHAPSQ